MEQERCTYCGKLPDEHSAYPWDHKPILVSEIIEAAMEEAKKPPKPGSIMWNFRERLKALNAGRTIPKLAPATQTLSAQPVASIVEMSDEQILEICKQSDMNEPNSRKRFGYLLAEGVVIGDFQDTLVRNVRAILTASRLDGANAGEKP